MSRDLAHGGGSWAFPKCVWAPTRNKKGRTWAFWSKILSIQAGDTVLHLRGTAPSAEFVGYSIASSAGYETLSRPPILGDWHYATAFYRADLDSFTQFNAPINLTTVFSTRQKALEDYFDKNSNRGKLKQNIFYVRQNKRLQCLNGAYVSTIDEELFTALFDIDVRGGGFEYRTSVIEVSTGQQLAKVWSRLGQKKFSNELKRSYGNKCCFPSCSVSDARFLVASHIARWSDNEILRGHLGNGLCLCLMHDKAFEIGLFTLSEKFEVIATSQISGNESPFLAELKAATGRQIRLSDVLPLKEALSEHWQRVGLPPI